MMPHRLLLGLLAAFLLLLPPGLAAAQPATADNLDNFLIRGHAPVRVPPGERIGHLVVYDGDAIVDGSVGQMLLVVKGNAVITGSVANQITVVNGSLDLRPSARVDGDIALVGSTMTRAEGATVTGQVAERENMHVNWEMGLFSRLMLWTGVTLLTLVAGLGFAAVAGRQLSAAGDLLTSEAGGTALAALVVWIGVPVVAVLAFATVVGIPLGLVVFVVLLPALGFLGYLVVGARVGATVVRALRWPSGRQHPYLAVVIGLLLLRLLAWVPVIGFLAALMAGVVGARALALLAFRSLRGEQRAVATVTA